MYVKKMHNDSKKNKKNKRDHQHFSQKRLPTALGNQVPHLTSHNIKQPWCTCQVEGSPSQGGATLRLQKCSPHHHNTKKQEQ